MPYSPNPGIGCGYSYNPCGAKPPTPEERAATVAMMQGALTAIGAVPGLELADIVSGLICLGQDDMVCAGLSFASAIPVAGWLVTGAKGARVGGEIADAFTKLHPPIKQGAKGGPTSGRPFQTSVKRNALEENRRATPGQNGWTCVYCLMRTDKPHVDHVIPKSRGGNATLENAHIACEHCNLSKNNRDYPATPSAGYEGPWPPPHWTE